MFHQTTRRAFLAALMLVIAAASTSLPAGSASAAKIKLLMVHNGGHDFGGFKRTMDPVLDKTGDFDVTVAEGFEALEAENLEPSTPCCSTAPAAISTKRRKKA